MTDASKTFVKDVPLGGQFFMDGKLWTLIYRGADGDHVEAREQQFSTIRTFYALARRDEFSIHQLVEPFSAEDPRRATTITTVDSYLDEELGPERADNPGLPRPKRIPPDPPDPSEYL